MTAANHFFHKKIASREVILEDASVFSRQWVKLSPDDPAVFTPAKLVESYLAFVRKCTLSLIRPVRNGEKTVFSVLGTSVPLLIFSGPEYNDNGCLHSATLRIAGGLLVQRNECGKGLLSFIVEDCQDGLLIAIEVSDYCPHLLGGTRPSRLRKWLYRSSQAFIHRIITSRFLCHLA